MLQIISGKFQGDYHAAAIDAARRKVQREMGHVDRFEGKNPIVYAGHLQEAH